MKTLTSRAFWRAVAMQLRVDLRINVLTWLGIINVVAVIGAGLVIGYFLRHNHAQIDDGLGDAEATMYMARMLSLWFLAFAGLTSTMVSTEMYQDYVTGGQLRMRIVPFGIATWMAERVVWMFTGQIVFSVLGAVSIGAMYHQLWDYWPMLVLNILGGAVGAVAITPLAILLGLANRGLKSQLVVTLGSVGALLLLLFSAAFAAMTAPADQVQMNPLLWGARLYPLYSGYEVLASLGGGGLAGAPLVADVVLFFGWLVGGPFLAYWAANQAFWRISLSGLARSQRQISRLSGL